MPPIGKDSLVMLCIMVSLAGLSTDGRRVKLEGEMENIQHHVQMERLRTFFFFGYASLGVRGEVEIRDTNLGALPLTDGN